MTMGTRRAGPTLDTAYKMTGMTFSSQMETGGFDFLKCRQMDRVTAALSKLLGNPSSHFLHRQGALGGFLTELWVDRPAALTHSPGATAFVSLFDCVLFMK